MVSYETYVVKVFVNNDVQLNSDFVFFLEANRSTPRQPPPPNTTCGG